MDYTGIHDKIIQRAKLEQRVKRSVNDPEFVYYERHHIVPKCLGGRNNKDNLVLLTAKEHFLIHKLLVLIHPVNKNLTYAVWMLANGCRNTKNYKLPAVGGREYDRLKNECVTLLSAMHLGRKCSKETRRKMSGPRPSVSGKNNPMYGKTSAMKGRKHTQEAKDKGRLAHLGRVSTKETRKKISMSWKHRSDYVCDYCGFTTKSKMNHMKYHNVNCKHNENRCPTIYKCEHCGLETENKGNYNRYHNDNCKHKS